MACVFKRKATWVDKDGITRRGKTDTYYARFDVGGKQYTISTGETTKAEAEKKLERLVALKRGEVTVHNQFNVLRDLVKQADNSGQSQNGDAAASPQDFLTNHFEPFLLELIQRLPESERERHCKRLAKRLLLDQKNKVGIAKGWEYWEASPNKKRTPKKSTLAGYEAIWKRFKIWATGKGLDFLHEVTDEHARAYAEDLWSSRVSPSTFNAHIKFLASVFSVLESNAGLTDNVWKKITRKDKAPDQGRRNLTENELKTILSKANGTRRIMFAIGLFTGLRLGDVINLRWDEIDHDSYSRDRGPKPGFLVVKPMKTSRKGKIVQLPIHPVLRQILDEHRNDKKGQEGDYVFPQERAAYQENTGNVTGPIQEFFETCGIKTTEKPETNERRRAIVRVGFHSLRHSFVSLAAKSGAPQHVIQQLVGHGSPAMTEHYTHLDDQQKQSAVANLPALVHATLG
jgi:integrase